MRHPGNYQLKLGREALMGYGVPGGRLWQNRPRRADYQLPSLSMGSTTMETSQCFMKYKLANQAVRLCSKISSSINLDNVKTCANLIVYTTCQFVICFDDHHLQLGHCRICQGSLPLQHSSQLRQCVLQRQQECKKRPQMRFSH